MFFMNSNNLETIVRLMGLLLHSFQLDGDVAFVYKVTKNAIKN